MDKVKLVALAERCEAAREPSLDLDNVIAGVMGVRLGAERPRYTASLDAAMTLVPEGWRLVDLCETVIEGDQPWYSRLIEKRFDGRALSEDGDGATPALALCAAALRSHAQREPGRE